MNPYMGLNSWEFLLTFFQRFALFLTGQLPLNALASDEIQIATLVGVALSASIVGTFLILRKMTMLANSLSHTILLGIISTFLLLRYLYGASSMDLSATTLLTAALATGIFTALFTEFLTKVCSVQADASNGLVFTTLFALGVMLISLYARQTHLDTEMIMGNLDALHLDDLQFVYMVLLGNLVITAIFFRAYRVTSFDPLFARTLGLKVSFYHYLLMIQISATTIAAFRAVGVLMVLSLITAPILIARFFTHRLLPLIGLSMVVGVTISILSVALSRHLLSVYYLPLSTSGLVVSTFFICYFIVVLFQTRMRHQGA